MTQTEEKALFLSRTLEHMPDKAEYALQSAHEAIDLEALDALCYNGLYGAAGKFDGHRYIYLIQQTPVGAMVLRAFLASYYRDQNPDGLKRDDDGELIYDENGEVIDLWDEDGGWHGDDDDLYWPEMNYGEVAQFWFMPNGQMATLAKSRDDEPCMVDVNGLWQLDTEMKPVDVSMCADILGDDYRCYDEADYYISDVKADRKNIGMVSMVMQFCSTYRCDFNLFNAADDDFFANSLREWGMNVMLRDYLTFGITSTALRHFHELKVAHRNHRVPADEHRWISLLENIDFCGGNMQDINNFAPQDFDKMFAYWSNRKESQIRKLHRLETVRLKNEMADAMRKRNNADFKYMTEKAAYLCIHFGNDKYDFSVIQNVSQFKSFGNEHGQCIYTNGYYNHPNDVLLICTDHETGKYLSTVCVNINSMSVTENLGHANHRHPESKQITQVVLENMQLFRLAKQAMQQCRDERDRINIIENHISSIGQELENIDAAPMMQMAM